MGSDNSPRDQRSNEKRELGPWRKNVPCRNRFLGETKPRLVKHEETEMGENSMALLLLGQPSNTLPVFPLSKINKWARGSGKCTIQLFFHCATGQGSYLKADRWITYPIWVVFTVDLGTSFLRLTKNSQFVCFQ